MLRTLTINTPEYQSILTPSLLKLAKLFADHDHEIRIAGGAVRDLLMGIVPHDIDFATTATPEQMKTMFDQAHIRMINANGEKHGTITVRIDDTENFEITTLRIDMVTDGRHATVEYTQDWQIDANRRDLTINALFLDFQGTIYDYFNGIEDLERRRIRFVGDPAQRIQEDYLRILRYFRFFGRLAHDGSQHEENTLKAIRDNAHGLKDIAGERLWIELKRIAEGPNAGTVLKIMLEQNVGSYLSIPSNNRHLNELVKHWQNCQQSKPNAMTILVKLFDDVHELEQFEQRMKYSNDMRRLSQLILSKRDMVYSFDSTTRDRLKPYKDLLLDQLIVDPAAKERVIELLKYHHHDLETIRIFSDWPLPRFPVTGGMLGSKGIKQGPNYKFILNELREKWKQSYYEATEQELLEIHLPTVVKSLETSVASSVNPTSNSPCSKKHKKDA